MPRALTRLPNADLPAGTRVHVYRNLHMPGRTWSVRDPATGRVVARTGTVLLTGARFVIQPGGQARARADGVRNVHAYVVGLLAAGASDVDVTGWRGATYHPMRDDTFIDQVTGGPVTDAERVLLGADGVRYLPAAPGLPGSG